MNGEIKFRVWDGERMHHPKEPHSSNHGPWHMNLNGLCYFDGVLQDVTFLQYTGLKDKNGVEIYEGDVVEHEMSGYGLDRGVVRYEAPAFYVLGQSQYVAHRMDDWPLGGGVTVIGNIYENLELVE